jgi:hypothetical protein
MRVASQLVCAACGGARILVGAELRRTLMALTAGEAEAGRLGLGPGGRAHAELILSIVDAAMAAHAGFEREPGSPRSQRS